MYSLLTINTYSFDLLEWYTILPLEYMPFRCFTLGTSCLIFIERRKIWLARCLEHSNDSRYANFTSTASWLTGWSISESIWPEHHSSRITRQCPDPSCRHTKKVLILVSVSLLLINNKKDDYLRFCCLKGFIKLLPKVGKGYYCLHMFARIMQCIYSGFPSRCLFKCLF